MWEGVQSEVLRTVGKAGADVGFPAPVRPCLREMRVNVANTFVFRDHTRS